MNNTYTKFLSSLLIAVMCAWSALAIADQSYDIKEMTPQVQSALEGRRNRYDQVNKLKAKGLLGENNKGYVEVLKSSENAVDIAKQENADRKIIYQTIADQNSLTGFISTIEKAFAAVQREKAAPGDMIQNEDGKWEAK